MNLPSVEGLCLQEVAAEAHQINILVAIQTAQACCPLCGQASTHIHSRYQRTVDDLPVAGVAVRLLLQVRRFRCGNKTCQRSIFCERLGPSIAAYARRTQRLDLVAERVGLALGGEAGARLLRVLAIGASPDTLLRVIRHLGEGAVPTPRILGMDDWAWRRGQRYGTLLCDLERHCVVDLLPDRQTDTVVAWLREHPGVEVISRDRAGNYAEAGRLGAPSALQVADRWHLIQNLAQALDPLVRRLLRSLLPVQAGQEKKGQPSREATSPLRLTPAQQTVRELMRERFLQVQPLYEQGLSLHQIAQRVQIDKNTLRYFVQSQPWGQDRPRRGPQAGKASLTPYLPYLHKRWKAGCQNSLQLFRELQAQGYTGSVSNVKPYVAFLRQVPADLLAAPLSRPSQSESQEAFSRRHILWLTLAPPQELTQEQIQELAQVCALSKPAATALTLAQQFVKLLREKKREELGAWLQSAQTCSVRELRQFARGIERDRAAVEAAFSSEISQGQTEGHVNRLKVIKRQMYGRAKFDLLRLRVIHAA